MNERFGLPSLLPFLSSSLSPSLPFFHPSFFSSVPSHPSPFLSSSILFLSVCRDQRTAYRISPQEMIILFFEKGPPLDLELFNCARVASQPAPVIHKSPSVSISSVLGL